MLEKNEDIKRKTFIIIIILVSLIGFALRLTGIRFEGVDYRECLITWFNQLKEIGSLRALMEFEGDYNLPYVTVLYLLTYLPIEPLISIKLFSIVFDYLGAGVLMAIAMEYAMNGKKRITGALTYALILCLPITVINSGYLAQSDGIWASLALLSFWYIIKDKPVKGMFVLGCALVMKLQAIFILPFLLIFYWYKKSFSILHIIWVPVAIQVLSIPAIFAGCGWGIAFRVFKRMLGRYPHLYYYYPNIWTYFQDAPYYVFGIIAILMTFVCLLMIAILFFHSNNKHTTNDFLGYATWVVMTCTILLPCMHERYNYLGEIMLVAYAVSQPKLRYPAVILTIVSLQCYGQHFLGWSMVSPYFLAACNIGVYAYLATYCIKKLYGNEKQVFHGIISDQVKGG